MIYGMHRLLAAALMVGCATSLAHGQRCGESFKLTRDAMPVSGFRVGVPQVLSFYTGPTWFADTDRCVAYVQ